MQIGTVLMGEKVVIRDFHREDLAFVTGIWFHPENGKFLSDPVEELVDEVYQRALDGLEDNEFGYYLIMQEPGSGLRVGTCSIFPSEDGGVFDLGYCVHRDHWRQGIAGAALELLIRYARDKGAKEMTAEVADENTASVALLKKYGFCQGEAREFEKYHMGIRYASHIYRLLL